MKERICRVCGSLFEPTSSRQLDCNKPITRTCICGNTYVTKCSKNANVTTCSKKCANMIASRSRQLTYQKQTRICELCGEEFHPTSNTQKYCKKLHELECVICNQKFIADVSKPDYPRTCSKECAYKLRFQNGNPLGDTDAVRMSYKAKTGYDHPMHNPEVIEKLKATNIERYGAKSYPETEEYQQKRLQTCMDKYGTAWPSQNKDVQAKVKQTLFEHHQVYTPMASKEIVEHFKTNYLARTGYEHPANNPDVVAKREATNLERYGVENAGSNLEVRNKIKQTMLDRYGVEYAGQSEEILDKIRQTNLERYGNEYYLASDEGKQKARERFVEKYDVEKYSQLREWKISRVTDQSKIDEWLKFLDSPEQYLEMFSEPPTYRILEDKLGVNSTTISYWVNTLGLQDKVKYTLSNGEDEIVEILKQIDPALNIVRHDRKTIAPRELDVFLPDYNIAIEFNPTVTHNSSIPDPSGSAPKMPSYHLSKSNECAEKGVFLFHIFGDEWTHQKEIIISMLRNLLGKCENRIYARQCEVKEVDPQTARQFLIANHRQGATGSSIKLGLYHNNELVSLMTFGKMRSSMGTDNTDLTDCWELSRFCSKLNHTVVGGASKLLSFFKDNYHPTKIRSFSDQAHTKGKLYETLGFTKIRTSDANYVWVNIYDDRAYHRINAQKKNIKQFLHDDSIDLNNTEKQIMIEHGFVQVFDSGTITWEWTA